MISTKYLKTLEVLFLRLGSIGLSFQEDRVSVGVYSARLEGQRFIGKASKSQHPLKTISEVLELALEEALDQADKDWREKMARIFASGEAKTIVF